MVGLDDEGAVRAESARGLEWWLEGEDGLECCELEREPDHTHRASGHLRVHKIPCVQPFQEHVYS